MSHNPNKQIHKNRKMLVSNFKILMKIACAKSKNNEQTGKQIRDKM